MFFDWLGLAPTVNFLDNPHQLGIGSALPSITVTENVASDPKGGFKNFGEYAYAVHQAGLPGLPVDPRLSMLRNAAAPGLYGSESAGADGGFLIPPQFAKDIFQLSLDDEAFLPLTDNIEVSSNSLCAPQFRRCVALPFATCHQLLN